jgi:hypothetical protein
MYVPEPFNSRATRRFIAKSTPHALKKTKSAIPALQRSRKILGDRLLIMLDSKMEQQDSHKEAFKAVMDADLGAVAVKLGNGGFWRRKWLAMIEAGNRFGWPLIWFDFLDAEACGALSAEEEQSFNGREIVIEFERFRCFGPTLHKSNGQPAEGRVVQPHTCIYFLNSPRLAEKALDTGIDHDQIALASVFEKEFGVFQDSPIERLMEFSSRGLFGVNNSEPLTSKDPLFKPKFVHKRACEKCQ